MFKRTTFESFLLASDLRDEEFAPDDVTDDVTSDDVAPMRCHRCNDELTFEFPKREESCLLRV